MTDDYDDDYDDDTDWDTDYGTPVKEEPDCHDCCDSGCPSCGYVDPDNPEHLRAVADQLLYDRVPAVDRAITDEQLAGIPARAHAAIRELAATAIIQPHIIWPGPDSSYSTEPPY